LSCGEMSALNSRVRGTNVPHDSTQLSPPAIVVIGIQIIDAGLGEDRPARRERVGEVPGRLFES
jgi:hypothetical protein